MKKGKKISHILILALLFFSCCTKENEGVQETSMKGMEIYSWEENNSWNYVVTIGTNAIKDYESIINSEIIYYGEAQLKSALSEFPQGESFYWLGEGWLNNCWDYHGSLRLPPGDIISEIKVYCKSAGLNLYINY